jgi:hypothetical protein
MQSWDPLRFVLIGLAGWINKQQRDVIDYLQEENRVLRDHLAAKRLVLSDEQRRHLAVRAKKLGRQALSEVATLTHCAESSLTFRHVFMRSSASLRNPVGYLLIFSFAPLAAPFAAKCSYYVCLILGGQSSCSIANRAAGIR